MKRISKHTLKQIILESRNYIRRVPGPFVGRRDFRLPEQVRKVVVLYGVRRSGKTYMLYRLLKENPDNSLYIDFEDERLDGFTAADFETLREAFYELYPALIQKEVYFLFDEIQEVEGWEKFCRRMVEKTSARVFVAGSSTKIYPQNISTTLRGRCWSIHFFPFSFREYLEFNGIAPAAGEIPFLSDERLKFPDYFSRYLKWGGFPEVVSAREDFEKRKIINEYLEAIFFKDLVERYEISNIPLIKGLRNKIFSTFSTRFSLSAFYKSMKDNFPFSRDLLYRYYHHLLESGTVFEVRKFTDSEYKRTRNPAKVYIVDSSLSIRVSHDDSARLLENAVFIELARREYGVHYFTNGNECDFVLVKDNRAQVMQVTYRMEEGNRERELNGLLSAAKRTGVENGLILTYNEEEEININGFPVEVMPAWKWLLEN